MNNLRDTNNQLIRNIQNSGYRDFPEEPTDLYKKSFGPKVDLREVFQNATGNKRTTESSSGESSKKNRIEE